jgi:succinate dehydrogenase / fumarate reductase flavoprotein subunit
VDGEDQVYLDVTHVPAQKLTEKLGGVLEIYEKFVGADPRRVPMRIFPAVHYTMGGLWVDFEADAGANLIDGSPRQQATNIPGLYAVGEADHQYHGGNRLGANSLLSCVYAGMIAGPAMLAHSKNQTRGSGALDDALFASAEPKWRERFETILKMDGKENPYRLARELGVEMTRKCTVIRRNDELAQLEKTVLELTERARHLDVLDSGRSLNQAALFVNELGNMLEIARVIVVSALRRDECRGSHYKPEFALPEPKSRNPNEDAEWMEKWRANTEKWRKTTMARWTPEGPELSYREIETPVIDVEPRWYG